MKKRTYNFLHSVMKTPFLSVPTQDKTYNIPVCLWLEESYPQTAPLCYVTPTREMKVLRGKFMSTNGEVTLPYLNEWKKVRHRLYEFSAYVKSRHITISTTMCNWCNVFLSSQGECDLVSLLQVMCVTFEENPPVCSLLHQPLPEPYYNSCK